MKQKRLTIIAIACGAVCAICVLAFMGTVQGEANAARAEALARYGGEQVDVCVATRDIASGERIDSTSVEMKLWVADLLPEGAFSDAADVVGRTATSSILKGEVLSEKRFDQARDALEVPEGMAAVSVPAKTVRAVGGAVRPGMRVDIYATGDTAATAIAVGVPVLATSSDEGGSLVGDSSWITIALEPEKVQEMVTASSRYDLYFVLPGDSAETAGGKVDEGPDAKEGEANAETGNAESVGAGTGSETSDAETGADNHSAGAHLDAPSAGGDGNDAENDEDADEVDDEDESDDEGEDDDE